MISRWHQVGLIDNDIGRDRSATQPTNCVFPLKMRPDAQTCTQLMRKVPDGMKAMEECERGNWLGRPPLAVLQDYTDLMDYIYDMLVDVNQYFLCLNYWGTSISSFLSSDLCCLFQSFNMMSAKVVLLLQLLDMFHVFSLYVSCLAISKWANYQLYVHP